MRIDGDGRGRRRPVGYTLMESMVAVLMVSILATIAVPSYRRAVEQARADIALANLRAIWAGERIYWLDQLDQHGAGAFTGDLTVLTAGDYLARDFPVNATTPFSYAIRTNGMNKLEAVATRNGSTTCSGELVIDEDGATSSSLSILESGQPHPLTLSFTYE